MRLSPRKRSSSPAATDIESAAPSPDDATCQILDPDEIEDYNQLRSIFGPETSLALLDNFAKWLFALSGTVGSIATGFGVSAGSHLGDGKKLFAVAVGCVALALALATLARIPMFVHVNRYDPTSMRRALNKLYWWRGGLLTIAGLSFAAGLVIAACVPLLN